MAQRTTVTVTCDPHGDDTEGTETLGFALDGTSYEIDVCPKHAKDLRERFGPFIEHARRSTSARPQARRHRSASSRDRSADVRAWAAQNGYKVSERGRIPVAIDVAYDAAH